MPSQTRRVAIITGAAQGIGRAVALRLAKDGHNVAISDLESKTDQLTHLLAELETQNHSTGLDGSERKFMKVLCDVSNEVQVLNLVDTVVKDMGRLDCVSSPLLRLSFYLLD